MNPCLFQSPAGAASTFEPFRIPVLATLYTAPSRSFGVRLVHREWSYGLSWVSPLRLCLPSPCALIIADLDPLVKGFLRIFYEILNSLLGRSPTARLVLCHFGVPLLGYGGRPLEGLGFASPPDTVILSHYRADWNCLSGKVLHHF